MARRNALAVSLLVVLLALATSAHSQITAPQLWKARARDAGDNLKGLQQKLGAVQDRWESREANTLKCEAMLESAFILHLTEEAIAHKVLKDGRHAFKIILSGGDRGLFDLTYTYDSKTWEIVSTEVLALPRAWEVIYPAGPDARKIGAMMLVVRDSGDAVPRCVFGFSQQEPFFAHVSR